MKRSISDDVKIFMILFGAFILLEGFLTWYHLGTVEMVLDTVIQVERDYSVQGVYLVRCKKETFELRQDLLLSGVMPSILVGRLTPGFTYLFKVNGKNSILGHRNIIDMR